MAHPAILLADSVTVLEIEHRGCVLVAGSHGGIVAAHYAACAAVRAAMFNDAGGGLDDAGVAGLSWLDRYAIPAATVGHREARIGSARQTLDNGRVSRVNAAAARLGVAIGAHCRDAVRRLLDAEWKEPPRAIERPAEGRYELHFAGRCAGSDDERHTGGDEMRDRSDSVHDAVGLDSIGRVEPYDHGRVLVIGSHCELHGGDPRSALPVEAGAAFFHDAGYGSVGDACSRLPELARRGVVAAAVAHTSARIGDARSMWATGVLSRVNVPALAVGLYVGMGVRIAAERISAQRGFT